MKCAVGKCKQSNSKKTTVSFYNFPKDVAQRKLWVMFCNRWKPINVKKEKICALHFKQEDYERNLKFEMGFSNRRAPKLKPGAVPTIDSTAANEIEIPNEIEIANQIEIPNEFETVTCDEEDSLQFCIKTLEMKLNELRQENGMLKMLQSQSAIKIKYLSRQVQSLSSANVNLDKALRRMFTNGQIKKLKNGDKRQNFTEADIAQSITLYSTSAKAYNLLRKNHFPLPSVRTLQRWSQKLDISRADSMIAPANNNQVALLSGHNDVSLSLHYPIIVTPVPKIRERKCHIKDCGATDPPHKLYGFPANKEKRNEWMSICQVDKKHLHLRNLFICKMHFRPDMIGKDRLRTYAFPFPHNLLVKAKLDKKSKRRCHVKGCSEPINQNKLHELPTDKNLRNEWIANCNIEEIYLQLKHLFVCEFHFKRYIIDRGKVNIDPSINMCKNSMNANDKAMIMNVNLCNVKVPIGVEIEQSDEIIIKEAFLSNDENSDDEIESTSSNINEEITINDPKWSKQNMVNMEILCMNANLKNVNVKMSEFGNSGTSDVISNAAYLDNLEPTLCKKEIDTVLPTEEIKFNVPELQIDATSLTSVSIIKRETEIVCENCGQSRGLEAQMKLMKENFRHEQQMILKRIEVLEKELRQLKIND